jgi:hypothetical protein
MQSSLVGPSSSYFLYSLLCFVVVCFVIGAFSSVEQTECQIFVGYPATLLALQTVQSRIDEFERGFTGLKIPLPELRYCARSSLNGLAKTTKTLVNMPVFRQIAPKCMCRVYR